MRPDAGRAGLRPCFEFPLRGPFMARPRASLLRSIQRREGSVELAEQSLSRPQPHLSALRETGRHRRGIHLLAIGALPRRGRRFEPGVPLQNLRRPGGDEIRNRAGVAYIGYRPSRPSLTHPTRGKADEHDILSPRPYWTVARRPL